MAKVGVDTAPMSAEKYKEASMKISNDVNGETNAKPPSKWKKARAIATTMKLSLKLKNARGPVERSKRESSRHRARQSVSHLVVKEALRKKHKKSTFMMHPAANFIAYWTLISIVIICFIFITVPFFLCFDPVLPPAYVAVDVIVDVFFLCDIVVNFRTGYFPNLDRPDHVIMDPYKVALVYARSWFLPDLICGFPVATLTVLYPDSTGATSNVGNLLKLLKLGRFLRLVKLVKVGAMSHKLDEFYLDMMVSMRGMILVLRFLKLLMVGFIIVHFVSCGWWLCGTYKLSDPSANSWVHAEGADEMNVWAQYLFSCYWAITTMTTVGYGDTSAMNDIERAFSIFAMILGGSFYGLLIAKITNIVAESENNQRVVSRRLDEIALFVHDKRFPHSLQRRVLDYYQKFLKKTSTVDEYQIIRELSSGIREQVVGHMLDTVIARGPFFSELGQQLIDIVPAMHMTLLDQGQYLARKGQPSKEMICIITGTAVVLDDGVKSLKAGDGEPVHPIFTVYPGALFGERCILGIDHNFTLTVRALTNCDCYVISADEFKSVVKPEVIRNLRLHTLRSLAFRIRVRTYSVTMFESDTEKAAIEKVVRALPPDPNKRTWNQKKVSSSQLMHKAVDGKAGTTTFPAENVRAVVHDGQVASALIEVTGKVQTLSLAVDKLRTELLSERQARAKAEAQYDEERRARLVAEARNEERHTELLGLLQERSRRSSTSRTVQNAAEEFDLI